MRTKKRQQPLVLAPGKVYTITRGKEKGEDRRHSLPRCLEFMYLGTKGRHMLFQNIRGKYTESFTSFREVKVKEK